jgi:ABC-2 type transport system ATP-binding protein
MSEMALTADHLVIIGRGRLLADTTVTDFVRDSGAGTTKVVSPEATALADLLTAPGVDITTDTPGTLQIRGTDAQHIGRTAAAHGIPLYELTPNAASLEEAFMDLTRDALEYPAPLEGAAA